MEDDAIPLSQLANEAFNLIAPIHDSRSGMPANGSGGGPTDFSGLGASLARAAAAGAAAEAAAANGAYGSEPAMPRKLSKSGKLLQDPIHGSMRLNPESTLIFDSRQFQRLRRLKQLGLTYMVFPGASHNRFEHSLGVAHLAQKFATHLYNVQRAELEIERRDLRLVELAGLCHDLGHGDRKSVV